VTMERFPRGGGRLDERTWQEFFVPQGLGPPGYSLSDEDMARAAVVTLMRDTDGLWSVVALADVVHPFGAARHHEEPRSHTAPS
jgi:hypothetical protein